MIFYNMYLLFFVCSVGIKYKEKMSMYLEMISLANKRYQATC